MKAYQIGFICLWLATPVTTQAEKPRGVLALDGRPAPTLRLADTDGNVTDLADLRGHWVMVHFWASWCGPCRREMPAISRMAKELVSERLRLVMVNTAETDDEVFAFLAIHAPDLTSLMDRDGQVTDRWQPRGLPASFFVDPEGRLRFQALGGRPWDTPSYRQFLRGLAK
jgi:cytochrome c biogenesis protein CcmG, thiol:disulfide interchange protein DsbE